MSKIRTIFIGYDDREKVAYEVLLHSIKRHSSRPVEVVEDVLELMNKLQYPSDNMLYVCPLKHKHLRNIGMFDRPWHIDEQGIRSDVRDGRPFSVDFSHSRFLVPLIQKSGWAIFMDCDQLFIVDPLELEKVLDNKYAIQCVKHDHRPKETIKMDAQPQANYSKKNWSSFVMWNCSHPSNHALSVSDINTKAGSWLHGFEWLKEEEIGKLDPYWNYLAGYYGRDQLPYNIHYTSGSPFLPGYENCDYADEWWAEYGRMIWKRLM